MQGQLPTCHTFRQLTTAWNQRTQESKATTHFAVRCRCHSICAMPLGWSGTCIKCVKKITLSRANWSNSKCICCYYLKNYYCYHVIVIAVNEHLVDIPTQYKTVEIERKLQTGRPQLAKQALVRQQNFF